MPLWLAHLSGTPVVLYGQSFGPFRLTRPIVRRAFRLPVLLFPRERASECVLTSLGVESARILPTDDPVLSLGSAPAVAVRQALLIEGMTSGPPILALAVSPLYREHYDRRPIHRRARRRFVEMLAAVLDRFVQATAAHVVFLPFATAPSTAAPAVRDDRTVARQVAARARGGNQFVLVGRQYPPSVLRGMIAECDLVLASRMHANVLAASVAVPSVGLGYSHKSPGLFDRLGLREYALLVDTVDEVSLLAALLDAWRNGPRIRSVLGAGGARARAQHRRDARAILGHRRSSPDWCTRRAART
jgi:polysaccharide pyruvyl transferase WcaK-like protein